MEKENNNVRDFYLGLFTALGLEMLINKLFIWYFFFDQIQLLVTTRIISILELGLYILGSILIYKYLKISPQFKKWFIIFAVVLFIISLAMSLTIII